MNKVKDLVTRKCSETLCTPTLCDQKILCDKDKEITNLKTDLDNAIKVFQQFEKTHEKTDLTKPLYIKEQNKLDTAQQKHDKAENELYEIATKILDQGKKWDDLVDGAKARGAVVNSNGGYVATTRRVILNGVGQKRVVYKRGGKGDDYVKIGGAFVNLKRNFTKKR